MPSSKHLIMSVLYSSLLYFIKSFENISHFSSNLQLNLQVSFSDNVSRNIDNDLLVTAHAETFVGTDTKHSAQTEGMYYPYLISFKTKKKKKKNCHSHAWGCEFSISKQNERVKSFVDLNNWLSHLILPTGHVSIKANKSFGVYFWLCFYVSQLYRSSTGIGACTSGTCISPVHSSQAQVVHSLTGHANFSAKEVQMRRYPEQFQKEVLTPFKKNCFCVSPLCFYLIKIK